MYCQIHTEKKEEQDNADSYAGCNLFSECFFGEPIVPLASFTLFSTSALKKHRSKEKQIQVFLHILHLTSASEGSHSSSSLAVRDSKRKQSKK